MIIDSYYLPTFSIMTIRWFGNALDLLTYLAIDVLFHQMEQRFQYTESMDCFVKDN